MYARIIDNNHIEYCPQELLIEAKRVIGFTEEFLNKHGYYKLVLTERDIDSDTVAVYEEHDNLIIQRWETRT